jgi:hypothetical protein
MDKRSTLPLQGAALCGALWLSGCANHMSQRNEHEERVERKLLEHSMQIDVGEPVELDQPQRRVRVNERKTFEVTEFEVTRYYDRYTPYQPWRKIYEIPLGAISVVGGLGANVVNVFALGRLPDSVTHDWITNGLAGLNPFMNMPSNGRAEQNLASVKEVQKDQRQEATNLPWGNRLVDVTAGSHVYPLNTDRNGYLRIDLLDSPIADNSLKNVERLLLSVNDEEDHTHAEAFLVLNADLRNKLLEAHHLIFDDLENDEVGQWVQRIKRLSQLGFEGEASDLEQSLIELTRNDPELQRDFLRALARSGRDVAVPASAP